MKKPKVLYMTWSPPSDGDGGYFLSFDSIEEAYNESPEPIVEIWEAKPVSLGKFTRVVQPYVEPKPARKKKKK